jgi:hypothetical protein
MTTRQNRRRNRKSKRGGDLFSQTLRSFGVPGLGPSTSEATKQIVNILTSARLTEDQKTQIRPLLPPRDEKNKTFYENLNRDLGNAGINAALAMPDILSLFPPPSSLPSVMKTIY